MFTPLTNHFRRVCQLTVAFAALIASPSTFANVILDGGFDGLSTAATGVGPVVHGAWTFWNDAAVVAGFGNPGNVVRLESGGSAATDPVIAQTVAGLTVGASYLLEWDLALKVPFSGVGTGRSFGVFLDSQSYLTALFIGEYLSAIYTTQSASFVATSTSHTILFAGELDGRSNGLSGAVARTDVSYWLDNVSLESNSVPEGGVGHAVLITIIGFTLLGARSTRRASVGKPNIQGERV
jgi:hypothetical protein